MKQYKSLSEVTNQYKILHNSKHYGQTGNLLGKYIKKTIKDLNPKSILDFGSGRSNLVNMFGIEETYKYDPAIEKYSTIPNKKIDLVLCTEVLEHIPKEFLIEVLNNIKKLSENCIFSISLRKAGLILPNGNNAHATIESKGWWVKELKKYFEIIEILMDCYREPSIVLTTFKHKGQINPYK